MDMTAADILGEDAIEALFRPIEEARGLPTKAYTSQEFYDLEQQVLFPKTWVGVAFDTDVPEPGDAMPITASGLPLIIVRDRKGEVRAFHNVCRHRATIILQKPEQGLTNLQCPYHAWTWDLEGNLKATPYFDGTPNSENFQVDPEKNGLVPVRCGVWNHVVFINIEGNAPPLEEYVAPAAEQYACFDLDTMKLGHRIEWEYAANWKLVNDNWENYHNTWIHAGIFDKMSDEVNVDTGELYTDQLGSGSVISLAGNDKRPPNVRKPKGPVPKAPLPIPLRPGAKQGGGSNSILPNTTVSWGGPTYAPVVYTPIAPDRTLARMAFYFAGEAATSDKYAEAREYSLDRWLGHTQKLEDRTGIRPQDHSCMELQQRARKSPAANRVQFSPTWENNIHYFQKWLVEHLS